MGEIKVSIDEMGKISFAHRMVRLHSSIKNDPEMFLLNELKVREHNNLPPFVKLIALIISSTSKELSYKGALEIKNRFKE